MTSQNCARIERTDDEWWLAQIASTNRTHFFRITGPLEISALKIPSAPSRCASLLLLLLLLLRSIHRLTSRRRALHLNVTAPCDVCSVSILRALDSCIYKCQIEWNAHIWMRRWWWWSLGRAWSCVSRTSRAHRHHHSVRLSRSLSRLSLFRTLCGISLAVQSADRTRRDIYNAVYT